MEVKTKQNFFLQFMDWLSLLLVCFILSNFGKTDPGEFIFLLAYENLLMLFVFCLFGIIAYPLHKKFLNNKLPELESPKLKGSDFFAILIGLSIFFVFGFFILLFLNQLTIELIIAYLGDNGYHFASMDVLNSNKVFWELREDFEMIFHKNFSTIILFFGGRYLLLLLLNLIFHPNFKSNANLSILGIYRLISNAILAPISMFIAMILLVILTAIFGNVAWIVLFCLAFFKLIYSILSSKTSNFLESL